MVDWLDCEFETHEVFDWRSPRVSSNFRSTSLSFSISCWWDGTSLGGGGRGEGTSLDVGGKDFKSSVLGLSSLDVFSGFDGLEIVFNSGNVRGTSTTIRREDEADGEETLGDNSLPEMGTFALLDKCVRSILSNSSSMSSSDWLSDRGACMQKREKNLGAA